MLTCQCRLRILRGLAVGDALGAGTEGSREEDIRRVHGEIRGFVPGSPYGFAPGEFTDDTQMVLCVLAAYRADPEDLLARCADEFVAWVVSSPPDVGGQTRMAITSFATYGLDGGWAVWDAGGRDAAGNGGLMRAAAPVIAGRAGEELYRETVRLTALTHPDPRSLLTCLALVRALECLGLGAEPPEAWSEALALTDRYPLAEEIRESFGPRWAAAVVGRLATARAAVRTAVQRAMAGDPGLQRGYVLDTLQSAAEALSAIVR